MKKFTILLLMAALATTTFAAEKVYGQQLVRKAKVTTTATVKAVNPISPKMAFSATKADVPAGMAQVILTVLDTDAEGAGVWGDGSGYQMLLDADATAYGNIIPETGGLTSSGNASAATYAEFEYKIPENADGSLSTTNMIVSGTESIVIPAGVYDWCITNPTPGDRVWIASANGSIPGRYDDFEFASGASYEFVISLGGSNDQVNLTIDDPTAPQIPTDLTATPAATTADIAWVPGENNAAWNLRYRPWVDPSLMAINWDFPYEGYEDWIGDWSVLDADEDGAGWSLAYTDDAQTDLCFYSSSYDYNYGGALTPDNWLFTPEVTLGGTLKFDTWNYSSYYLDKIMVYVCTNPDWESVDEFVAVSDFFQPGQDPETFEVDLSAYEGTGVIAFRHYDCSDLWRIYLDNISIDFPGALEPAEWIYVNEIDDNPYTIEGLTPETEYEVQVQGIGEDGRTSDWTESVNFTTLAEETGITELYMVGSFNSWNQTEEGGRIPFVLNENNEFVAENVALGGGDEFKLITPSADAPNGWIWFGGLDENQVGYFLITPELLTNAISLVDGSNFRMEEGGIFTITVTEGPRGLNQPLVMTVEDANPTAIRDLNTEKSDNTWYNIQGMKLNGVPTAAGIYINGGKKVVIK